MKKLGRRQVAIEPRGSELDNCYPFVVLTIN